MTSIAMDEIRKIRDENSLKYIQMGREERTKELAMSVDWFVAAIGKQVPIFKDKPTQ